jgi:hypothetical protein
MMADLDVQVTWEPDWSLPHSHEAEYGEAYEGLPNGEPETCEQALAYVDGEVYASLGCIDGADEAYRDEIERDLIDEALSAYFAEHWRDYSSERGAA